MPATIEELISALRFLSDSELMEPELFINVHNKLAVRYKYYNLEGENLETPEYGVWVIDLENGAKLSNIS